ncbi:MAG: hypothetical protein HQ558_00195 [Candidatus Omnitrophica bacterium]|nr:hypothetical protein [Candidatus Omnitrophota bacterium]
MGNKRGSVLYIAIVLSMLLMLASAAVYSLVSGRFTMTNSMNERYQALQYTESASYVTYQMFREGTWTHPNAVGAGNTGSHTVTFTEHGGTTKDVAVAVDGNEYSPTQHIWPIRATTEH